MHILEQSDVTVDPITLEIFNEELINIVREMRGNMIRTAFSSAVCEMHDMSCAILNPDGQLMAISDGDNPQHIFPIIWSVQGILEKFNDDIHPGDVFIHNDPLTGGTHLNDIAVVAPLFVDGELAYFPVVRVHFEDVGGMVPGSVSPMATTTFQEGVRIPIVRAFAQGKRNDELFAVLFSNMRVPDEREGDFEAMLGTSRIAQRALSEFVSRHGTEMQRAVVQRIMDRTESQMRDAIGKIPPGQYRYELAMDPRGENFEPPVIRVCVTVKGRQISVDFTGTSPQTLGPYNLGPSGTPTGVFMILKALLDPGSPVNSGSFRPIEIINPPGTFLHPTIPVGFGAMGDVRRNVEMAVMGALARVLPADITGETKSTANQTIISGISPATGKTFILYEGPTAGTGGFREHDGNSAMRTFLEGDFGSLQSVEAIEAKFPLRVEKFTLRQDSGGPGKYRGGLGYRREVRFLGADGRLTVLSERNVLPPYGVEGGICGWPTHYTVLRNSSEIKPSVFPGKIQAFPLELNDIVVEETSGGGGYGDPLTRSVDLVQRDYEFGYVSEEASSSKYGVVIKNGYVDEQSTNRHREAAVAPIVCRAVSRKDLTRPGGMQACLLAPATASETGLVIGAVVEILTGHGAPLRALALIDQKAAENSLGLAPVSFEILGITEGKMVQIRPLGSFGGIGPEQWQRYLKCCYKEDIA